MNRRAVVPQPVAASEAARFQSRMATHHDLGGLPKIGHPLGYVAIWQGQWLALRGFSAAAWPCAARDAWSGWDGRQPYARPHLIANNRRFLILPQHPVANLASRVLALSERRLAGDWPQRFGYPWRLLATLVDPRRFHGTRYRAAHWPAVGATRG